MSDDNKEYDGIRYRAETKSPLVFRVLFGVLALWAFGFMGHYLTSGWSSQAEYQGLKAAKEARLAAGKPAGEAAAPAGQAKNPAAAMALGKKVFAERCASCHGPDAKGGIGPDLTRKQFTYGKTAEEVTHTGEDGRPGGMPSFKNDLSHDQVEGVVGFVLSL